MSITNFSCLNATYLSALNKGVHLEAELGGVPSLQDNLKKTVDALQKNITDLNQQVCMCPCVCVYLH